MRTIRELHFNYPQPSRLGTTIILEYQGVARSYMAAPALSSRVIIGFYLGKGTIIRFFNPTSYLLKLPNPSHAPQLPSMRLDFCKQSCPVGALRYQVHPC